jgi:hypothetical protein
MSAVAYPDPVVEDVDLGASLEPVLGSPTVADLDAAVAVVRELSADQSRISWRLGCTLRDIRDRGLWKLRRTSADGGQKFLTWKEFCAAEFGDISLAWINSLRVISTRYSEADVDLGIGKLAIVASMPLGPLHDRLLLMARNGATSAEMYATRSRSQDSADLVPKIRDLLGDGESWSYEQIAAAFKGSIGRGVMIRALKQLVDESILTRTKGWVVSKRAGRVRNGAEVSSYKLRESSEDSTWTWSLPMAREESGPMKGFYAGSITIDGQVLRVFAKASTHGVTIRIGREEASK